MNRSPEEMVAYALEIEPKLLRFIPELLADLEVLGCNAKLIVETIENLPLPADGHLVDLGCGKGAVALAIAEKINFQVTGVDLFQPFIDYCNEQAAERGISHKCKFHCGDIQAFPEHLVPADVVVYAALGDVLGPFDETIRLIRRFAKPGGYILFNDDYVRDGVTARYKGFENYRNRRETIQQLQSAGDNLIAEYPEDLSDIIRKHEYDRRKIRQRAEALSRKHPELKEDFLNFANEQDEECIYIEENLVPVVWVLQRV